MPGSVARAGARADRDEPARRGTTAAVRTDQMAQDRRAGRRHPLPADAVVAPGEAGQQCRGRRRRHRQQAMPRLAPGRRRAAAVRRSSARRQAPRRCCRPRRHPAANPSRRSRGNARPRSATVDRRLRPRRGGSGWRPRASRRPSPAPRADSRHHVRKAASAVVMIVAALAHRRRARSAGRACLPLRASRAVVPRPGGSTAAASASTRARRSGQGIEQGGDEHVAGDAADGIEMDVQPSRSGAPDGPARHRALGDDRDRRSPWRATLSAIAASTEG